MRSALLMAAVLILLNSGCRQPAPTGPSIRIVLPSAVASIDPQTTEDPHSISALTNVYEPLIRFNSEMKIVPNLAVSWSNPTDNTWIFKLRKDVRFHNGKPFGARDVKYSLDRGLHDPKSAIRSWLGSIRSIQVINQETVELTTTRRSPLLLFWLTSVLMIPMDSNNTIGESGNGTGPYQIDHFQPDVSLDLKRFEDYWDQKPVWKQAVFTANPDAAARLRMIEAGEAELASITEPYAARVSANVKILEYPASRIAILGFSLKENTGNIFTEPAIRKAIALAIDRQLLIDEALNGMAEPATQFVPFAAFGFDWKLPAAESNLEEARKLLAPFQNRLQAKPKLYFGPSGKEIANHLQKRLAKIGIQMDIVSEGREKFDEMLYHQDAPAYILQFGFPTMDASDILYDSFHTTTADKSFGSLNFSGYSNPKLDAILEQSSIELNPGRRYEMLKEGMQLALDSNVMIPLCVRSNLFAARERIQWAGNAVGRITLKEIQQQ